MKKLIFAGALIAFTLSSNAQTNENCETIPLKTKEEVVAAEPCIETASTYILSKPVDEAGDLGKKYRASIFQWMEKTEYTFSLNEKIMNLFKGDNALLFGIYTAALSKTAIVEKQNFEKKGLGVFVEYIKNENNNVKQSKAVKQLISDWDKGNVEAYLK